MLGVFYARYMVYATAHCTLGLWALVVVIAISSFMRACVGFTDAKDRRKIPAFINRSKRAAGFCASSLAVN